MNNLVDYGADSDDESPRRRSSEGQSSMAQKFIEHKAKVDEAKRKRRSSDAYGENSENSDDEEPEQEFTEPPPPKRVDYHSPSSPAAVRTPQFGMTHTTSQASLVSYSGDGDEDDDQESDSSEASEARRAAKHHHQTSEINVEEPAPPPRQTRINEEEDDEEQKLIDEAIREGNEAIMRMGQGGDETPGHDSVVDSPFDDVHLEERTPTHPTDGSPDLEEPIRIPAAPRDVEVNPKLQSVFENAFRQKAAGADLNKQIQGNPKYNNPMIYTTFIETFDIDEKGTNFPPAIFDPHVFPESCYYDAIGEEQRRAQEAPKKK